MNRLTRSLWNHLTRTGTATAVDTAVAALVRAPRPRASSGPLALEPRLMFDAAAVTAAAEAVQHAEAPAGAHAAEAGHGAALADAAARLAQAGPAAVAHEQEKSGTRHDLVFIDTGVQGWQALRDGVLPGTDVVLLDPARDGLTQMLAALQGRSGLDSIQVISHGVEGQVYLGSLTLDTAAVGTRAADLARLGAALAPGGDLLLLGCRVAGGTGQGFIDALAAATGADVAASTDNTGAAGRGGENWMLEARTGPIDRPVALTEKAQAAFSGHLALLQVDSADDSGADATVGGSLAADSADGNGLSLREAMFWANNGDTIQITAAAGSTINLNSTLVTRDGVTLDTSQLSGASIIGSGISITNTLTINTGSQGLSVFVPLSGDTLVKTGSGILFLETTNSHGDTLVSQGSLAAVSDDRLGSGTVTLNGGTLSVGDNGGGSANIDNTLAIGSNGGTLQVYNGSFQLTWSGAITGSNTLTKSGTGQLTLSNSGNSGGFSGGITVSNGTLSIDNDGNLGTGTLALAGGALAITGTSVAIDNDVVLGAGSTISNANTATLSGNLSGTGGGLVKAGAGTLALSGANVYTGTTTVSAGTLALSGGLALSDSSAVTVAGGATLRLLTSETIGSLAGSGTTAIVNLGTRTLTAGGDNTSTSFAGNITGTGGLTKTGTGTLSLSGSNTFSGATTVSAGGLTVSGGAAIANNSAVTVSSGATLTLSSDETIGSLAGAGTVVLGTRTLSAGGNGTSTTFSGVLGTTGTTGGLIKSGGGTFTLSGSGNHVASIEVQGGTLSAASGGTAGSTALGAGTVTLSGGNLTLTGSGSIGNALALQQAGTLTVNGSKSITGLLSGSAQLTLDGSGSVTLTNTGNTTGFSGGMRITDGVVSVADGAALGSGTITLNGGSLSVTGATTVANAMNVTNSSSIATSAAVLFSGVLGGSAGLSLGGTGTATLSGTSTYSGTLTVGGGTALVTGSLASVSAVTVASGGTLGGTGVIGGSGHGRVTVQSGGTISPGVAGVNGGAGVLTLGNGLTINSGGTLRANINGSTPGTDFDQLDVTGTVDVSGATLSIQVGAALVGGDSYRLINNDASDAITGTFSGIADGSTVSINGGQLLRVSMAGGTGNDLVLLAVIPPVVGALGGDSVSFTRGDSPVLLDAGNNATLTNAAGGNFNGGSLTVSITGHRVPGEDVLSIRSQSFGISVSGGNVSYYSTVIGTLTGGTGSSDLVVSFNNQADATSVQSLLRNMTYSNSNTGSLDASPRTVSVTVNNGQGGVSARADITVNVDGGNRAPIAQGIGAQTADEDSPFNFTVPADAFSDADALSYGATLASGAPLPAWLHFDGATGHFSGIPQNGDVGSLSIRVTATDPSQASANTSFTLTVANTNDAPTAAPIAAQAATQGTAFSLTLPASTFADVDVGDTLSWKATLADGGTLPAWLSFDAATHRFSGTPGNADVGSLSVRVTATDSANASASSGFTLTVANVNDAPVAAPIAGQAASAGRAFSFTLPGSAFTDVDVGDKLTLTATLADGSALPAWLRFDAASGSFSGTPADANVGSLSVRVTATDTAHASASSDFTLTVAAATLNHAPVASPIGAQAATEGGAFSFTLPGSTFTDVDAGDALSLKATLANGNALPAWLSFDAATGHFSGTPAAANVGSLSVRVTATDTANTSASSDFTLTVAAAGHHAPVLATPSGITLVDTASADSFSAVGGQLSATADAGSTLRYAIDGGSAGQAQIGGHSYDQQKTGTYGTLWLDSATGQYVYVPVNGAVNAAAHAAQDVFGLSVSDGSLKAATALTVDIAGVDDRPQGGVALAGTAQVGQVLTATASLTDAEGLASTTLRWQAQAADGSWADVAGATGTSFTPGAAQAGHAVRVVARVTDAQGGVAEVSSTASATVQAAPVLPPVVLPPEVVNPVPPAPPPPLPAPSGPLIGVPSSPGDLGGIIFSETLPGIPAPAPARVASNPLASNPASITVIGSTSPPMGSVLPNPARDTGLPSLIGVGDSAALALVPPVLISSPAMGMVLYNLPPYYLQAVSGVGMQLSAAQVDGKPLPPWLSFDATKGEFKGTPPHGYKGTLHIMLTVRDAQGHMATTTLDVEVAPIDTGTGRDKVIKPQAAARTGLSEQLQAARRPALGERLNEKVATARATAPQTRT